jgi:hypothetical protein
MIEGSLVEDLNDSSDNLTVSRYCESTDMCLFVVNCKVDVCVQKAEGRRQKRGRSASLFTAGPLHRAPTHKQQDSLTHPRFNFAPSRLPFSKPAM